MRLCPAALPRSPPLKPHLVCFLQACEAARRRPSPSSTASCATPATSTTGCNTVRGRLKHTRHRRHPPPSPSQSHSHRVIPAPASACSGQSGRDRPRERPLLVPRLRLRAGGNERAAPCGAGGRSASAQRHSTPPLPPRLSTAPFTAPACCWSHSFHTYHAVERVNFALLIRFFYACWGRAQAHPGIQGVGVTLSPGEGGNTYPVRLPSSRKRALRRLNLLHLSGYSAPDHALRSTAPPLRSFPPAPLLLLLLHAGGFRRWQRGPLPARGGRCDRARAAQSEHPAARGPPRGFSGVRPRHHWVRSEDLARLCLVLSPPRCHPRLLHDGDAASPLEPDHAQSHATLIVHLSRFATPPDTRY